MSSGDLAANKEISLAENSIINGNLFSDNIKIAEDTRINGNISFNKLKAAQNSQVLGEQTAPISLPVVKLPAIPEFQTGTQNLVVRENQAINPGNFMEIEVKEGVSLTVNPGIYNLDKFQLRDNSTLLFSGPTMINIKDELKVNEEVLIAPTASASPTDLQINYISNKPLTVGKDSLISAKILVPKSKVNLGDLTTFRGQIISKEINVGEESVLSRQDFFSKESDPGKVVEDQGLKFVVNEIVVLFRDEATQADAQEVAGLVNGKITDLFQTRLRTK